MSAPPLVGGWRWLVTILVLAVLVLPVVRDRDGLPLSTYPMYAHTRPSETVLVRVQALDPEGSEVRLSIRTIADTRDPLVAQSYLDQARQSGSAATLCADVASRVSTDGLEIRVLEERHDVVARATGQPSMRGREVLAECRVG